MGSLLAIGITPYTLQGGVIEPAVFADFTANVSADLAVRMDLTTTDASPLLVDWGDGTVQNENSGTLAHTYAAAGAYDIRVLPTAAAINKLEMKTGQSNASAWTKAIIKSPVLATYSCQGLLELSNVNIIGPHLVTSFATSWADAGNGTSPFPLIDFSNVTSAGFAWNNSNFTGTFPALDFSNVTNAFFAWNSSNFTGSNIQLKVSSSIANSLFNRQALIDFIALLDTTVTGQSLNIVGNPGVVDLTAGDRAAFPSNWTITE